MKTIQDEINKIRDRLILRVDSHLEQTPEAENAFNRWSRCFGKYDPETEQAFEELKPHVKWPV